jgi:hypothetical protein
MSRLTLRVLGGLLLGLMVSCGDDGRPPPAAQGDGTIFTDDVIGQHPDNVFADGPCEDGDVKQCRVYLPAHGQVQPCFVGEQTCVDGAWSDCGDTVLVDANELEPEPEPDPGSRP